MAGFRDIQAWQKTRILIKQIYVICDQLPDYEKYGLASQMRRAAISVSCNIVEGSARGSWVEFIRFLKIARTSASELETQLIHCHDLGFSSEDKLLESARLTQEVQRLINGLIQGIKEKWGVKEDKYEY